jgi:ribosomal protein S18 acetylase RimI-like enzyme
MEYRHATAQDAPAIATLHADSWRRNYRGAFSDAFLDGDVHTERMTVWTQRLSAPKSTERTIVADNNGVVVGFAHTVFDDDPTWGALLDNLHVAGGEKRSGIGRHLMVGTAEAVLERTPATGLYLWVLEQNVAAQAFYGAPGGTCVERGFGCPPGGGNPPRLRYAWADPSILLITA